MDAVRSKQLRRRVFADVTGHFLAVATPVSPETIPTI
jgi:hypothetical protein